MSRKYIGVDLGAWYGNKTRIAILEEDINGSLNLLSIQKEKMEEPIKRNEKLVELLLKEADGNALIGIDAPFAIPYYLYNPLETKDKIERLYNPNKKISGELNNQMIFDNSARFIFETIGEKVLAPAGDKIGKMTARMVQIVGKYTKELNIIKTSNLDTNTHSIATVEVYPRATLYQLNNGIIPQYKNKKSDEYFKTTSGRKKMLEILKKFKINISIEVDKTIKSDDDYDAIVCALTAYLISQKDGYEKPDLKEDEIEKMFTNSFIYIPKAQ